MGSSGCLGEKAVRFFRDGYNCSESVLLTMTEHWGCKDELIPRVATPFGGGMGRCGSVCGAVTGGVMAIGVRCGRNAPTEKPSRAYELAETFFRRFEKQNGSVVCRELIGLELSDPEQRRRAQEDRVFEKKCTVLVRSAVEILAALGLETV
jgi:C_GCAxxG_C_C family probable redox protein